MTEFVTAIGLVLVIEGVLYSAVPSKLKEMMHKAQSLSDDQMRFAGVIAVAAGVAVVWAGRTIVAP
jgi:uncharacterized protein